MSANTPYSPYPSLDHEKKSDDFHAEHAEEHVAFHQDLPSDAKVLEVANAEYARVLQSEHLNPRSKESIQLYLCCAVSFLCACANGYDGSLMTAILAMKFFQNHFNVGDTGPTVSVIFSLYTVGSMVGAFSAPPITDRFGRRVGMFVGGVVICLGMAVISSANKVAQLIVGRFILGWGISIMTCAAPAYCVEIAPPQWRGKMVGIYNCGWFGGAIPAAAVTFGCNYIQSNISWRLPLILQGVPSIIVMFSVWFLPESPRWLMMRGREQEARDFLVKYHGNTKEDSLLVKFEFEEFKEGIAQDGTDKVWWDYRPLFRTKNARWRMAMVLLISVFGQFSGNGLGYFNTVIFRNLGVTTSAAQLGYNLLNQCLSAFAAVSAAFLADTMPRRRALVWGTFACACCLAANGALGYRWAKQPVDAEGEYINPNLNIGRAGLAFYFLFNIVFSFAYTPLQGVYPAENLESTARAKGMSLSGVIVSAIGFINAYAGPIALQNIQNNYVFVFVGWDLIETVIWYFFCVETVGRTLEELEEVYSSPNPVAASKRKAKVAVKKHNGEVQVIQEVE